jgi:quercetin dioxygenase-like cupin family protein
MSDGREVVNQATGERIRFLRTAAETGGELLEMEDLWPRADHTVAEHAHPAMEERWQVLEGRVRFEIDGRQTIAGPGDVAVAPAGARHASVNIGGGPALLRIEMRPALRWEEFVRRLFAATGDGSGASRIAALLDEFEDEIELGRRPQGDA